MRRNLHFFLNLHRKPLPPRANSIKTDGIIDVRVYNGVGYAKRRTPPSEKELNHWQLFAQVKREVKKDNRKGIHATETSSSNSSTPSEKTGYYIPMIRPPIYPSSTCHLPGNYLTKTHFSRRRMA